MQKELWIGDYSVLIWIPKDASYAQEREIIRKTINEAIAGYGMQVVNA